MKQYPTQEELLRLFDGDFIAGELVHRFRHGDPKWKLWNPKFAGKPAGSIGKNGYVNITIYNTRYLAHRILWKIITGLEPLELDHINRNKADNRYENLREITHQKNGVNQGRHKNSISGYKGVHWDAINEKWVAQLKDGDYRYAKRFSDLEEAIQAHRNQMLIHHGEFACIE